VKLRYVLSFPWASEAGREVRRHIPWLLAVAARVGESGDRVTGRILLSPKLWEQTGSHGLRIFQIKRAAATGATKEALH